VQPIQPYEVARRVDATVLIVDDSADVRELIEELLADVGYKVVAAPDGAEALRLLRGGLRPRVILLDRNTPVLDGPRLLQEANDLLSGIAIVWMTGEPGDVGHPSVVATLRKPFEIDDLIEVVRAHSRTRPRLARD